LKKNKFQDRNRVHHNRSRIVKEREELLVRRVMDWIHYSKWVWG
uniref:Transposase n=1 Tax=Anisakis simplex TaxID=6269 RepID=A0A0M3JFK0_ANISI